jgi:hypothetical protein
VLVSDGEDLAGRAREAAGEAARAGVRVFAAGLGSREGAPIPLPDRPEARVTHDGEAVVTRLRHETLYRISRITGGVYLPIETAGATRVTLGSLYRGTLGQGPPGPRVQRVQQPVERFQLFLAPACALFIAAGFMSRGRLRVRARSPARTSRRPRAPHDIASRRRPAAPRLFSTLAVFLATCLGSGGAVPPPEPDSSSRPFNRALALMRAGRHGEAAEVFGWLAETEPNARIPAWLGLGSSLFRAAAGLPAETEEGAGERLRLIRRAAETFQDVLRADPQNLEARHNLAVALRALPEAEAAAALAAVRETASGASPPELIDTALREQRQIASQSRSLFAAPSPDTIRRLEDLARRLRENRRRAQVLGQDLAAAARPVPDGTGMTPELTDRLEAAAQAMQRSADRLEAVDAEGTQNAENAAQLVYGVWRTLAAFPHVLREAIRVQDLAIDTAARAKHAEAHRPAAELEQNEAAVLTRLFTRRLEESAAETAEQPVPRDVREEVHAIAGRALAAMDDALRACRAAEWERLHDTQEKSRRLLLEIQRLVSAAPDAQPPREDRPQPPAAADQAAGEPDKPETTRPRLPSEMPGAVVPAAATRPDDSEGTAATPEKTPRLSFDRVEQMLNRALQREQEHSVHRRRAAAQSPAHLRDW